MTKDERRQRARELRDAERAGHDPVPLQRSCRACGGSGYVDAVTGTPMVHEGMQ